jgi:hypothetical protein
VTPLLAALLLGLDLCRRADQVEAWWNWPAHVRAAARLDDAERAVLVEARERRHRDLSTENSENSRNSEISPTPPGLKIPRTPMIPHHDSQTGLRA